jgi:hypothetical protein
MLVLDSVSLEEVSTDDEDSETATNLNDLVSVCLMCEVEENSGVIFQKAEAKEIQHILMLLHWAKYRRLLIRLGHG